jgi:hypothetical protein
MTGNIVWGFIFGNVIASIFNVAMIGRNIRSWHIYVFWGCAVSFCIWFMLQSPPT